MATSKRMYSVKMKNGSYHYPVEKNIQGAILSAYVQDRNDGGSGVVSQVTTDKGHVYTDVTISVSARRINRLK